MNTLKIYLICNHIAFVYGVTMTSFGAKAKDVERSDISAKSFYL
jgi:hypothetical protein